MADGRRTIERSQSVSVEIPEDVRKELEANRNVRGGPPRRPFSAQEDEILLQYWTVVPKRTVCDALKRVSGRNCDEATARKRYRELTGES